jgi:hypothetical protein
MIVAGTIGATTSTKPVAYAPDIYIESEVLIRGVVRDAKVERYGD